MHAVALSCACSESAEHFAPVTHVFSLIRWVRACIGKVGLGGPWISFSLLSILDVLVLVSVCAGKLVRLIDSW